MPKKHPTFKKKRNREEVPSLKYEEQVFDATPSFVDEKRQKVRRLNSHDARIFWQHHLKPLLLQNNEKISSSEVFLDFAAKCKQHSFSLKLLESLSIECLERESKDTFQRVQIFYRAIMDLFTLNHDLRRRYSGYVLRLMKHFRTVVNSSYEIQLFLFKTQRAEGTLNNNRKKQVLPLNIVLKFLFSRSPFLLFDNLLVEVDSEYLEDPKAQRIPSTLLLPSLLLNMPGISPPKFDQEIKLEEAPTEVKAEEKS